VSYPEPDGFLVGANLPWIGYGTDIGASAWYPTGGLSAQPAAADLLDRTLATLAADDVRVVRTFLLCDARSGVQFDADGVPTGLDEAVLRDIDVLRFTARRHGVRLMPVLFDFHLCGPRRIVDGVQLGGRSRLVVDRDARRALIDLVVRPIVQHCGDDDVIAAWDVMNEPEWCLAGGPLGRRRAVAFETLQDFLGETVECVRGFARQPVTIGCARTTRLDLVRPLPLDFYQVHWYEKYGWNALAQPVAQLRLGDRPVILGEFPGRRADVRRILDLARGAGYAAALVWSVLAEDDQSAYPRDLARP
jgi:hypothetical protein